MADYQNVTGYADGVTSPDEIFARIYPSDAVAGDNPATLAADRDPDDISSIPAGSDTDPDDL